MSRFLNVSAAVLAAVLFCGASGCGGKPTSAPTGSKPMDKMDKMGKDKMDKMDKDKMDKMEDKMGKDKMDKDKMDKMDKDKGKS